MTIAQFREHLRACPLIASVQGSPGSPVEDPETLLRLAQASLGEGVRILRLEGAANIAHIRTATGVPVIGLIKRRYEGSEVYVTPTLAEVRALLDLGCEVVSLDATLRPRPGPHAFADLARIVHEAGRLVMADCDDLESARAAVAHGADIVGPTLSGYTSGPVPRQPDLDVLGPATALGVPVLAEGRYAAPYQVHAAMARGASGVVIGGALNDPVKMTRVFVRAAFAVREPIAAFDIGGTWLRYALFTAEGRLEHRERAPLPSTHDERKAWIDERIRTSAARHVGIATGGAVDPDSGLVWDSKPIIPDNRGYPIAEADPELTIAVLNDGLASAWGHANLPDAAGRTVATLALGTGVGFGWVHRGRLMMGARGDYPRLNDVPLGDERTIESCLGGLALEGAGEAERARARDAARIALAMIRQIACPDRLFVCGGVGLGEGLDLEAERSPFGEDAGLYGAAALVRWPQWRDERE